jgi:HK97 family phage major capsid protein
MKTKQQLREERQSAVKQMDDILALAKKEGRQMTAEEEARFDKFLEEDNSLKAQIKRLDDYDNLQAERARQEGQEINPGASGERDNSKDQAAFNKAYRKAFVKAFLGGINALDNDERKVLARRKATSSGEMEYRGTDPQTITPATAGGYAVPQEWIGDIYKYMKWYGCMVQLDGGQGPGNRYFEVLVTDHGRTLNMPKNDDTANVGRQISEATARVKKDTAFTNFGIGAWGFTSDIIEASAELIRDSAYDLEGYIKRMLAERLARIINTRMTTGNGTTQPEGIVTNLTTGHTTLADDAIIREDVIDLIFSVDKAYRESTSAALMFHDNTLKMLRKIPVGSGDDRPLWQISMRDGEPDTLEGYPYLINNDMAQVAASAKSMVFGDMSKFMTRFVGDPVIRFSSEYGFANNTLAWVGDWWADSKLIDNKAIKVLVNAAS